ncbi:MAG: hypothetical protein ACLR4Z_04285 [Butyricicoccaceae bacterium]
MKRCSAARQAAARAMVSCSMRCVSRSFIPARGSSCCAAPCPSSSVRSFLRPAALSAERRELQGQRASLGFHQRLDA